MQIHSDAARSITSPRVYSIVISIFDYSDPDVLNDLVKIEKKYHSLIRRRIREVGLGVRGTCKYIRIVV